MLKCMSISSELESLHSLFVYLSGLDLEMDIILQIKLFFPFSEDRSYFCFVGSSFHVKVSLITSVINPPCASVHLFFVLIEWCTYKTEKVTVTQNNLLTAAILDIAFTWKARVTMDVSVKRKQVLKLVVAIIWTIILPVFYAKSRRKYTCYLTNGSWQLCVSSYIVAVAFYMMINAVEMVLFFVPVISKYIEISDNQMLKLLTWWTQVWHWINLVKTCYCDFLVLITKLHKYSTSKINWV